MRILTLAAAVLAITSLGVWPPAAAQETPKAASVNIPKLIEKAGQGDIHAEFNLGAIHAPGILP